MKTQQAKDTTGIRWKNFNMGLIIGLGMLLLATSAMADVEITRRWATTSPTIDGIISPGEWNAAQVTPLTQGRMRTMNNGQYLFVLLDYVGDTHDDPVPQPPTLVGDYYVLAFDVDRNHAVTPNTDLIYSTCQDSRPFVKAFYLSPASWTGCRDTSAESAGAMGFGATPSSATAHRFYEFRLDLAEIGVDPGTWTTSAGEAAHVRVHVAMVSQNPAIHSFHPQASEYPDMSKNMFRIDLATFPTYPLGSAGPTFAGVGLVPSTFIVGGYANINIADYYVATDAPFGGKLHIFGNWQTLVSDRNARSYRVWYSKDGGALTQLLQTWTNFRYDAGSGNWIPVAVGPNADGKYTVPSTSPIWYLPNLLIGWQSNQFADGMYTLSLELFDAGGNPLPSPPQNKLKLFVVNTAPTVKINQVLYEGVAQTACAIVQQTEPPAGFKFNLSVNDVRGALGGYNLTAIHGDNLSGGIFSDDYSHHVDADGPNRWDGVTNKIVPVVPRGAKWRAPESCAYSFILSAFSRSQNGYGLIFPYVDYHFSLTIETGLIGAPGAACGKPAAEADQIGCKPAAQ
jgi:hypothetical protein